MMMRLLHFVFVVMVFGLAGEAFAIGQQQYVQTVPGKKSFPVVQKKEAASIYVDAGDWPGVIRAARDLQSDIERVTGCRPALSTERSTLAGRVIIIGTVGKSAIIRDLVKDRKIEVRQIEGKWESFLLQTSSNPLPKVGSALVIAGSDKRGTIYGIYDLCEQIGVSPLHFWADSPVQHKEALFVKPGKYVQGPPSVKYRGIFLNDESPDLSGWVAHTYGTIPPKSDPPIPPGVANYNSRFYERIFEVILRMKGNYLWPAMWNNAFNEDDPENPRLADEYGIVMGSSHQEPMLRAQKEWDRRYQKTLGRWNYHRNPDVLKDFWREGIRRNKNYESIVTIGLRGADDTPMIFGATVAQSMALLEEIVGTQRKMIAEGMNPDVTMVPQLWCLYKEVQELFDADARLMKEYNEVFAGGKWKHFMDQVHIGYTIWQDPAKNIMPKVKRIEVPRAASMGIAVEGSASAWPGAAENPELPALAGSQRSYIDVFNRGQEPFSYSVKSNQAWILLSSTEGLVRRQERIWISVDPKKAPKGVHQGAVTISGTGGETVHVKVISMQPSGIEASAELRYIDSGGYVSIEPERFSRNTPGKEARWERIEGYGRTLSAMTILPVTAQSAAPPEGSPCLEYRMYLFDSGKAAVNATLAPTLNFMPGKGLRYGISFDDEPPQIIDILPRDFDARNGNREWEESVRNASRTTRSIHQLSKPGYHTLKIWMVDPGVVLQKIVVDLGGLKPSYLGAPESATLPVAGP